MSGDGKPPKNPGLHLLGEVLSFGWVLPAAMAAGAAIGYGLDHLFGTWPVLTLVFGALGAASGLIQVFRASGRLARSDDGAPRDP